MRHLLGILFLGWAAPAFAGGEVPNGGDRANLLNSIAWFTQRDASSGARTIKACYEVSPDFSADKLTIERAILGAFSTWREYRGRFENWPGNHLVFDVSLSPSCEGAEDLKYYFGVTNNEVAKAKERYFDPVAFAEHASYDPIGGWSKGFIWVAKSNYWAKPHLLEAALLHETGHVMGCEHVPGTIMSENIVHLLDEGAQRSSYAAGSLTQIDGAHDLILADGIDYDGKISPWDNDDGANAETFRRMMGRAPQGKIHGHLAGDYKTRLVLTLKDDSGAADFPIVFSTGDSTRFTSARAFVIYWETPARMNSAAASSSGGGQCGTSVACHSDGSSGSSSGGMTSATTAGDMVVNYGSLRAFGGKAFRLVIERNGSIFGRLAYHVRIRYFTGDKLSEMFTASGPSYEL